MRFSFIAAVRHRAALARLCCCAAAGIAAVAVQAEPVPGPALQPSWGAIATLDRSYGYAFNHASRAAAESAARAQCDRAVGRSRACTVRAYFDRSCGAIALGNYGEWGIATAPTSLAAEKTALTQCDNHLPTQPCKALVSVCSPR